MSSRFSLEPCGRCGKKVNFGLQPQKTVVHKAGLVLIWNIRALGFDWRVFLAFISWAEIAHQQWFKSFWQEWWWPKQARQLCELYSTVYLSLKSISGLLCSSLQKVELNWPFAKSLIDRRSAQSECVYYMPPPLLSAILPNSYGRSP